MKPTSKHWLCLPVAIVLLHGTIQAQAIATNGSSGFLKVAHNSTLQLQHFTLEAWIYISGTGVPTGTGSVGGTGIDIGTAIPLITKGRNEKDSAHRAVNYFLGYRASDRRLVADFEDNTTGLAHHPFIGKKALPLNAWTHVAITYNTSGVWRSYINGQPDSTLMLGKAYIPQYRSGVNVAIGSAYNYAGVAEGFFNGRIDEVRCWNVERTGTQIAEAYNKEISTGTGLVARFSLNEGSGSYAANSVNSTLTGALTNGAQWGSGFAFSTVNSAPFVPSNPAPAQGANLSSSTANLCAAVGDPENKPLTVSYYGRKKTSTKKFTIVLLPDPQYYVANPQGTGYIKGAYNIMFKSQTKWIARNRATRNIVYVGGLGDCTDHGDTYSIEWKRVDTAIRTLEDSALTGLREGIPYGLPVGNHDQAPRGDPKGATYYYNKFFGYARYTGRSYYGGHFGTNNDNHYQLFSASGIDFLVICPEYDQTSGFSASGGVLNWMEGLVKAYPNRKVIVLSHYLINLSAYFTTQGQAIYTRLKRYPNVILLASGHIVNESTGAGEARRSDTYNGTTIHTITQDYQARKNGGDGLLRTYEFDPKNNKVFVQTYSPYTNVFETDANSQFSLDMNLSVASSYQLLGQQTNVASGTTACFQATGLENDAVYEWYVQISDGQNTTTGPVWSFATPSSAPNSAIAKKEAQTDVLQDGPTVENVTVYPNPNNTRNMSVVLHQPAPGGSIMVYNMNGQLVAKKAIANESKTISFEHHLPAGMYQLVLLGKNKSVIGTNHFLISR